MNCFEFNESGPKVPGDVIDAIFIVQCPDIEHLILNKVTLMILLFSELKAKLKISSLTTTLLLQTCRLFTETRNWLSISFLMSQSAKGRHQNLFTKPV